jgi:hypothetical protein
MNHMMSLVPSKSCPVGKSPAWPPGFRSLSPPGVRPDIEREPSNKFGNAKPIAFGQTIAGSLVDEGYFKFSTSDHYRNDVNIEVILEDDYKIQLDVQVYTAQKEEAHTVIWQRWDPPREIRSTFSAKPSSDYHVWLRAYSTLPLAPRYRLVITLVQ